jgi:hypothetical protein
MKRMANREIMIIYTDPYRTEWYGNTTSPHNLDFRECEWINGVLHIHLREGGVHTFNPASPNIESIQVNYGGCPNVE